MMSTPTAPRNNYLDAVKGILIVLVAWGHLIQAYGYGQTGHEFFTDPVFQLIYMFHMPLFIAISGYLSYHSINHHGFLQIVQHRFLQVIVPALVWLAILNTFLAAKSIIWEGAAVQETLFRFALMALKGMTSFWFLWAVFLFTVIIAFLKRFRIDTLILLAFVSIAYIAIPELVKITSLSLRCHFSVSDTALPRLESLLIY